MTLVQAFVDIFDRLDRTAHFDVEVCVVLSGQIGVIETFILVRTTLRALPRLEDPVVIQRM